MTRQQELIDVMDAAAIHWQTHARCASSYLRGRGLDWLADDPAAHGLGYAAYQWTELTDALRSRGFHEDAIEGSGLAIRTRRGHLIDRFRGRLMFPLRDHTTGYVVGATGRDLTGRSETPKYLNTPATPIFDKGSLLYGLSEQSDEVRRAHALIVTEGPLDALAMQSATTPAVAVCGTAVATDQAALIVAASQGRVVLAFDGDPAGINATIRTHNMLVDRIPLIDYLPLRPDQDPGQLARSPGESNSLSQCRPVADLIIDQALYGVDPDNAFAAVDAARAAARVLVGLPAHEWFPQIGRIHGRSGVPIVDIKQLIIENYESRAAIFKGDTARLAYVASSPPVHRLS